MGACAFGPAERPLSGTYHPPRAPGRGAGVVLCNPVGDDAVRAHRTLRHLAERLADAGFAVLRFDFHGTGDSSGDERAPGRVAAWIEDVGLALEEVRARSGAAATAAVGIGLGATLAMRAAAATGGVDSLVLWGPCASGRAFARESARAYRMHRLLEPAGFAGGPRSHPDGEEVFGFLLTHATLAELDGLDLRAAPGRPARRALVLGDGVGVGGAEVAAILADRGAEPERRVIPGCLQFLVEIPHRSRLPAEALDAVVEWLCERHPPGATAGAPGRAAAAAGVPGEEPVVSRTRRIAGVLHRPEPGTRGRAEPVVLLSAGTVHRIGPHRLYVTLARRWARLGLTVLRVDLSGIGDSPAAPGATPNVTYPPGGYDDVAEAMDLCAERTGARRMVLAGLCSGGDFAFQMALRDGRVASAIVMNPRTFCVNDLSLVEAAPGAGAARDDDAAAVPASLRRLAERGVDTFLLVSAGDPGVAYVDAHAGDAMRALAGVPGFRREDIAGTDHNFTSLWAQGRVSDLVTPHLLRRAGA